MFHAMNGCDATSLIYREAKHLKTFDFFEELLEHLREESRLNSNVLGDAEAFVCHFQFTNRGTEEVRISKERAAVYSKKLDSLFPLESQP